jgi:heat shock protein HslJ
MSTRRCALYSLPLIAVLVASCSKSKPEPTPLPATPAQPVTLPATVSPGDVALKLPAEVVDTTWQWVSLTTPVETVTVDAPDKYTVRFGSDGKLAVKADCNRGTSSYTVSADRKIALKPMALTRAMCPPGSLSDRFVKEVSRATSYFVKDGDFYLSLPTDSGTLRFRRQT